MAGLDENTPIPTEIKLHQKSMRHWFLTAVSTCGVSLKNPTLEGFLYDAP